MPGLPAGAGYAQLEAIYEDAQRKLELTIRRAILGHQEWTASRAKLQLLEVRQQIQQLRIEAPTLARDSVSSAYEAATSAVDLHTIAGAAAVQAGAGAAMTVGLHTDALNTLAAALAKPLDDATATVGRRTDDVFREIGLHQTAVGIAAGDERRDISAAIHQRLIDKGITGYTDSLGRNWKLSTYTNMVARTVTREAVSLGTSNRMKELELDLVTISDDGETDEICAEFAGNTYSLSGDTTGYEQLPEEPPFHPNAVMEGTTISAMGEIETATRARWAGSVLRIGIAGGYGPAIGPNHPVLTERGWLPAKAVCEGDYILQCARVDAPGVPDYEYQVPARVEDVFDALRTARSSAVFEIRSRPLYLHGDGDSCKGQINVVWADRFLRIAGLTKLAQGIRSKTLELDDVRMACLPGARASFLHWERINAATASTLPLIGCSTHLDALSLQSATNRNRRHARLNGNLAQRSSGLILTGERGRQRASVKTADRHTFLDQLAADCEVSDPNVFRQLADRFPGHVARSKVIHIAERHYDGWAFDFQVRGRMYFADSLALKNCIHVMTPAEANQQAFIDSLTNGVDAEEG
jgi:hypothetical protein